MNSKQRRKARRKRQRKPGLFFGAQVTQLWVEEKSVITIEDLRKALAIIKLP